MGKSGNGIVCHREERSDVAIHLKFMLDCRTRLRRARNDNSNYTTTGNRWGGDGLWRGGQGGCEDDVAGRVES